MHFAEDGRLVHFYRGLLLGVFLGVVLLTTTWLISQEAFGTAFAKSTAGVPTDTPRPQLVLLPATGAQGAAATPPQTPLPAPAVEVQAATPTPAESEPSAMPTQTATPACRTRPGAIVRGTFDSRIIGRPQAYRVYLPPCYSDFKQSLPVLYVFHGNIQDDGQWDADGLPAAADRAIMAGAAAPFVIAMPAGDLDGTFNYSAGGPRSFEQVMLDDFMPFMEATYHVRADRGGRAIGGLSRGAVWAMEIGFRHPDLFLSVGAHSSAASVAFSAAAFHPYALAAQAPHLQTLRIYMDRGEKDWYSQGPDVLDSVLTARGIPHVYVINPGAHDDAYWRAHVDDYVAFYAAPWSGQWQPPDPALPEPPTVASPPLPPPPPTATPEGTPPDGTPEATPGDPPPGDPPTATP